MMSPIRLVLLHTMDPRGNKLGGIETHVRQVLARHPEAMSVLFVGIDESGDLELGKAVSMDFRGRTIDFLPVTFVAASEVNQAAKTVMKSTTLRYAMGVIRHLMAIRRAAGPLPVSSEVERFEFALVPRLLGWPLVVLVHNEGTSRDAMDSLLKKYWFLHLFNERLALTLASRIFAVNASIAKRVETLSSRFRPRTEVMSVSVDTDLFRPTPFPDQDDAFHVCFAGRLDAFKDPPLMFETIARLAARLAAAPAGRFRRLVFDYVGASDPRAIPGFGEIETMTVRHGIQSAAGVAARLRQSHAGIITSFFEGLPCYLLETLASGRPVGAIALPQFAPLIIANRSGFLVDREPTPEASAEVLAEHFLALAQAIDSDALDPAEMAELVRPYSVEAQMHRLFACHEALALGKEFSARHGEPTTVASLL